MISSTNSYYEEYAGADKINKAGLTAFANEDGRRNYWAPASGTSMATPYVAGSIACWLEADPTLTNDDIKDIIAKTSVRDEDVVSGNPVQWGAGKFDAYAGLKEVLRRTSGITDVAAGDDVLMLKGDGHVFEIFVNGASAVEARIYSVSGALAMECATEGDTLTVDTSSLAPGVYIICVNNQHKRKIIIK